MPSVRVTVKYILTFSGLDYTVALPNSLRYESKVCYKKPKLKIYTWDKTEQKEIFVLKSERKQGWQYHK